MNYPRSTVLALLVLAAGPFSLVAQQDAECASYANALSVGALSQPDSQSRAYVGIQMCPAQIRAAGISAALDRRSALYSFDDPKTEAFAFATRDEAVFDLLARMTGDRTATPISRVLAIATLLAMVDKYPGPALEYFVKFRDGDVCAAGGSPIARATAGGPLPPDSTRRVVATLAPLERSRSTDPAVRSAAHCALNVLRLRELRQFAQLGPLSPDDLTLAYVCGSEFRVTSRSPFKVLAAMHVPGATRPVALSIQGTRGRSASMETLINGGTAARVRLVVDDVTYTATNEHRKCAR